MRKRGAKDECQLRMWKHSQETNRLSLGNIYNNLAKSFYIACVAWSSGMVDSYEHTGSAFESGQRKRWTSFMVLRFDVDVQNVKRQNVEKIIDNVEFISPLLTAHRRS
jgi:hypothetical protein